MKPESVVQSEIRAYAGEQGILLWRNNVGACNDETGRMIRYGLGNDSAQVQRRLKSSDLIGLADFDYELPTDPPVKARTRGVFLAVECKAEGWRFPNSWRGVTPEHAEERGLVRGDAAQRVLAQWRFLCLVHRAGGLAGFAQSVDDFARILQGELVLP